MLAPSILTMNTASWIAIIVAAMIPILFYGKRGRE